MIRPTHIATTILLVCALTLLPGFADASQLVEADGAGETKSDAIQDAQRNAVSQVLGAMLTSDTLVENFTVIHDKILTKVSGYVKRYDILSQSCDQGTCVARIKAQVEEMELADDVAALAQVLPRMNFPTIVVSIAQQTLSEALGAVSLDMSTVEQAMGRKMAEKGFRIAEASALEAEKLRQANLMKMTGNKAGSALEAASHLAQVIVSGQAVVQDNGSSPFNEKIHAYGAFISAKAFQTQTGSILASASAEASVPHHSFAIGTQKALIKAAEKLTKDLSGQIVKAWLQDCYNENDVTLIVENISFNKLAKLKDALYSGLKGVTRVNQQSFLRNRAELLVGWANCNTQRLAEKISGMTSLPGSCEVIEVQGNTIRLSCKK